MLRWRFARMGLVVAASSLFCAPCRADEVADPARPAAISTEEVPKLPARIFARLEQYQNMRSAQFFGWAPDGRGMLIGTRFGNSPQLHRVYKPGGRREQITFFEEPAQGRFIPHAKDNAVLVSMSAGGSENYQVYLLDRSGYRSRLLTDGTSRNELGPVSRDGSRMIVHSNRRNGRDTDLYLADCRQPDSMQLLLETKNEFWVAQDWSPDGKRVLVVREVSINESYPGIVDVASKTLTRLPLPTKGKAAIGQMAFAPDGKTAYVTTDAEGEFLELMSLDLETKKYRPLAHDLHWDVTNLEVEPTTGAVAFALNADGASELYLLEGQQRRRLEIPLGILGHLEFSPDGKQLGFSLSRPDAPADAYSLNLDDGHVTRWTFSETGGINPASFVKPERVQFASFDGREIPAYVFRPRDASPHHPVPVLVSIHGGPESQYRPDFAPLVQYYVNELHLAMVYPNVRGSAGYGKTYLQLDNGPKREDSVKDIGALLDWIGTRKDLDASRVGVIGGSYGGFMVLSSLVHYSDRLRAGIDIVGIANFITFLEQTSPYRQDLRRVEYGDERDPKMRSFFETINPAAHAEKIGTALLIVHGKNDPRVPFSEAEQIARKVRATGRPVWTLYASNEGHGFQKKDNRDYLAAVQTVFLEQNLIGDGKKSKP
jgi:dipeptidyl aminopeptidase/acylaminoacyl peptidase